MKQRVIKLTGLLAALVLMAACSDGTLKMAQDLNPAITVAPSIITFAADRDQIKAGESVNLSWEVVNADTVEISGISNDGSFEFHSEPLADAKGSILVEKITGTTEFVLTATKSVVTEDTETSGGEGEGSTATKAVVSSSKLSISLPKQEVTDGGEEGDTPSCLNDPMAPGCVVKPPSTLTDTAYVVVTVTGATEDVAKIEGGKTTINAGEKTVIEWSVDTNICKSVSVSASDGSVVVAKESQYCEAEISAIEAAPASQVVPFEGCAVVAPTVTTSYFITCTDADGNTYSDDVTIEVTGGEFNIKDFSFDDGSIQKIVASGEQVTIKWNVEPASAVLGIETGGYAKCELPAQIPAQGSALCKVSGDSTFTLTAMVGENKKTATISAAIRAGAAVGVSVYGPRWAFEGESIILTIEASMAEAALIESVSLNAKPLNITDLGLKGIRTNIVVPAEGVILKTTSKGGAVSERLVTQGVKLAAASLKEEDLQGSALKLKVSSANIIDSDFFYGLNAGYNEGNAVVAKRTNDKESVIEFSFKDPIQSAFDNVINPRFFTDAVKHYFVGAVAKLSEGTYAVATTGLIAKVDAQGKVIGTIANMFTTSGGNEHPSCKGTTQTGTTEGKMKSFINTCDMIVVDQKLIIATDHGAVWMDLNNESAGLQDLKKESNPTYGLVVNDVHAAKNGAVYAVATAGEFAQTGGTFKFNNGSWEKVSDVEGYALASDEKNVYVGTIAGVKTIEGDEVGSITDTVYTLGSAKDVLVAGTNNGVQVYRDKNWNSLTLESITDPVTALDLIEKNDMIAIAFGSADHFIEGKANLVVTQTQAQKPAEPAVETPASAPEETPEAEQPASAGVENPETDSSDLNSQRG